MALFQLIFNLQLTFFFKWTINHAFPAQIIAGNCQSGPIGKLIFAVKKRFSHVLLWLLYDSVIISEKTDVPANP